MRPGVNGTATSWPASLAACSTPAHPASTIRSASEICLPPAWALLNACWTPSRVRSTVASSSGSLTSQPLCGSSRMRAPFAPPRLSLPRNVEADAHAVETSWDTVRPEARSWLLSAATSLASDQLVGDRRDRVLPQQRLLRDQRAEVALDRAHVAVRQLEPGPGERVGELVRVLQEAPGDLLVDRVDPQREVGGQHRRRARSASGSSGSGTVPAPAPSFGCHWFAPAGLFVSSHS